MAAPVHIEQRAEGEGESRTVVGYAFKWESESRHLYGMFYEKIDRSALDGVNISDMDIVALFNHDDNMILARSVSDTLKLTVDDTGLRYQFEAPNTTAGNDLLENLRVRNVTGSSFAFTVEKEEWDETDKNHVIRTIKKFRQLYDVSPVVHPAYLNTEVENLKRNYQEWKDAKEAEKKKEEKSPELEEFRKYKIDY